MRLFTVYILSSKIARFNIIEHQYIISLLLINEVYQWK